jgi:speckle-type POZ protein
MEASLLRDPDFGFCIDDAVIFKVEITVYGDLEVVGSGEQTSGTGAEDSTLARSMFELLHFPTHSDVSFVVGAERVVIPAHKCILMARSPVFYAMFSHEMQEELGGEVCVPDIPVPVMREMLHHTYTGQRADTEVPPLELFHAAVKYQIPGLIAECERYFLTRMDVDTVVGLLEMADGVGAQHLKISCMQYIAQNASAVVQKRSFHELDEPLLRDVNRLITLVNKRKGCGGSGAVPAVERERRFGNACTVM